MKSKIVSVDEYMNQFDEAIQKRLKQIRFLILNSDSMIEEKISWGVPTYYYHGYLLQIAAYKTHIGFYTTPSTISYFQNKISEFPTNNKNTMNIPHDKD